MPSIKVKDHIGGPDRRIQLLSELGSRHLEAWKVEEGGGHMFIVTEEDKIDFFYEDSTHRSLRDAGYELVDTPEIRTTRTVIARQIDCSYGTMSEENVVANLNSRNCWARVMEASFLPTQGKSKILKIVFPQASMAARGIW